MLVAKSLRGTALAVQWRGREVSDVVEAATADWLDELGIDQGDAPQGFSVWEGRWPGGAEQMAVGAFRRLTSEEWLRLASGLLVFGEEGERLMPKQKQKQVERATELLLQAHPPRLSELEALEKVLAEAQNQPPDGTADGSISRDAWYDLRAATRALRAYRKAWSFWFSRRHHDADSRG